MIAKTAEWSKDVVGIPLEAEVLDARGLTVKRERLKLPAGGFAELAYTSADTAPTGAYTVNLYLVKDDLPGALIGTDQRARSGIRAGSHESVRAFERAEPRRLGFAQGFAGARQPSRICSAHPRRIAASRAH